MSDLLDLYESTRAFFVAKGWATDPQDPNDTAHTEFFFGKRYQDLEGHANRIVFVPAGGPVNAGPIKLTIGKLATIDESCLALIWGASGDDSDEGQSYRATRLILERLLTAFEGIASGRITYATADLAKDTRIVSYGDRYAFKFSFKSDANRAPASFGPGNFKAAVTVTPRVV